MRKKEQGRKWETEKGGEGGAEKGKCGEDGAENCQKQKGRATRRE